jgi:membrane-associated protease RseP (regulator of RpoE activity)
MNQFSIFAAGLPRPFSIFGLATIIMAGAICPVQGQNALQQLEQRIVGEKSAAAADGVPRSVVLGLEAEERGFSAPFQIVVLGVRPGSAAEAAGLRGGDEIVAFDNKTVASIEQMAEIVRDKRVGDDLGIVFRRSGQTLKTTARFSPAHSVPLPPTSPPASGSVPPVKGTATAAAQPVEPVAPLPTGGPRVDRPEPGSGRLGVTVENASTTPPGAGVPVRRGAVIVAVNPASPAATAGLEVGNAIVSINGVVIADAAALIEEISKTRPGDRIDLTVYKADVLTRVSVTLVDADAMVAGADGNAAVPTPGNPIVTEKPGLLGGMFGGLFGNSRPNPADDRGATTQAVPQAPRPGAAVDGALQPSDPPILSQPPVDGTASGGFNPSAFSGFSPPSAGTVGRPAPNGDQKMPEPLPEQAPPPNNVPTDPQDVQGKEAEVQRLKMEVEMLRKQLEQLQQRLESLQK